MKKTYISTRTKKKKKPNSSSHSYNDQQLDSEKNINWSSHSSNDHQLKRVVIIEKRIKRTKTQFKTY